MQFNIWQKCLVLDGVLQIIVLKVISIT